MSDWVCGMHRSRLAAIGIDVPADVREAMATFWSAALGATPKTGTSYPEYTTVGELAGREVFVQELGSGAARIHLDIETDDVDAEVARLEGLGARKEQFVNGWWIMTDPSGQPFCVVPPQTADFPGDAAEWA